MKNVNIYLGFSFLIAALFFQACSKNESGGGSLDSISSDFTGNETDSILQHKAITLVSGCPDFTTESNKNGFVVTAGSPKDLTKYRKPYSFQLPTNPDTGNPYKKRHVVGTGTDAMPI